MAQTDKAILKTRPSGNEGLLASDRGLQQGIIRTTPAGFAFGFPVDQYETLGFNAPEIIEALRRWHAGDRMLNTNLFEAHSEGNTFNIVYSGTKVEYNLFQMCFSTD